MQSVQMKWQMAGPRTRTELQIFIGYQLKRIHYDKLIKSVAQSLATFSIIIMENPNEFNMKKF